EGSAGAGLDFLGMHRQMIAHQQKALELAGDPLYTQTAGWAPIPFDHADPGWPMPPAASTPSLADEKDPAETASWKSAVATTFESDTWLKTKTLDELGTAIEDGG